MRESRDDGPFEKHAFAIAAGFLGAFFALWVLDFAVIRADWCAGTKASCTREWISATSGWAAAIVATLAAALTYGPLQKQVAHAKRQTDFAVGDADPSFDAILDLDNDFAIVMRISNWNRRTILVEQIVLTDPKYSIVLFNGKVGRTDLKQQAITKKIPLVLEGWIDRNKNPTTAKLRFFVLDESDTMTDLPRDRFGFMARYKVLGEVQTRRTVSGDIG